MSTCERARYGILAGLVASAALTGCQHAPSAPVAATMPAAPAETTPKPVTPDDMAALMTHLNTAGDPTQEQAFLEVSQLLAQSGRDHPTLQQLMRQVRGNIASSFGAMLDLQDPEARARVTQLLAFNEGLANFSVAALQLPASQREAAVAWGFSPGKQGGAALVALVFSGDKDERMEGARRLADVESPTADWMLGQLILDPEREVSLTAMDVAWDRTASDPLVDALWQKAILYGLMQSGYRPESARGLGDQDKAEKTVVRTDSGQRVVKVGERSVQLYEDNTLSQRMTDGDVATDVLIAYQSPLVMRRIEQLFQELIEMRGDPNNNVVNTYRMYLISPNYGNIGTNMQRLIEAYKPRNVVRLVVEMVLSPTQDGWDNSFNNQVFRFSTRIDALGVLARLVDLDREELKLVKRQEYGNRWAIAGRVAEEEAAVKKAKTWWAQHRNEYEKAGEPTTLPERPQR